MSRKTNALYIYTYMCIRAERKKERVREIERGKRVASDAYKVVGNG